MLELKFKSKYDILTTITRDIFILYLFYCFFEMYMNIIFGQFGRFIIFVLIITIIISYSKVQIKWYHISILLWLLLKVTSILWVSYNYIVSIHLMSQLGMVGLFFVITMFNLEFYYTKIAINVSLFSSGLLGFLCMFLSEPYQGKVVSRQVLTIQGAQTDPNNQAAFLLIGISIALYKVLTTKMKWVYKIILIAIIGINIYAIFLTGSRGGLVSLAFIFITAALFIHKGKNVISAKALRSLLFLVFIGTIIFVFAKEYLPEVIFDRLFSFDSYEGGSERIVIWENVINIFYENPLIGGGWGSFWGYNGVYSAVHNTFLAELTDGGLIGLLLFLSPMVYIVYKSLKYRYILPVLILISGVVPSIFIDAINKRFFWNAFILSMFLIQHYIKEMKVNSTKNKELKFNEKRRLNEI